MSCEKHSTTNPTFCKFCDAEVAAKEELKQFLLENGYTEIRYIGGVCVGLMDFAFTTGIVVGLTEDSYEHRYCYSNRAEALDALRVWNDINTRPSGKWIKLKGRVNGEVVDMRNPNL